LDLEETTATMATVVDKPASSHGQARRVLGSDVITPRDAMRLEELQSTKVFVLASVGLGVAVLTSLPFMHADPIAKWVLVCGIAIAGLGIGWAAWSMRRPGGYQLRHSVFMAATAALGGYTAIYYFGILSAASLATGMGIFFFALTQRQLPAVIGCGAASLGPIGLWALVGAGVLEDRGMIPLGEMELLNQIILLALVQLVFLVTYVIARGSRRSRLNATEELELAVRQIAQREALLDEARRELDRALEVGGPGRFTDQVLGSFRLGVVTGRGAMGEVYEAVHTETKELAAVKLLNRSVLGDPEQVRRFTREANIARALVTPHIVRVLEVGDDCAPLPYIAMELLRGEDLAQMLRRRRKLPVEFVVRLIREIGSGVHIAHEAGVVHRDLKPQNLFLQRTPDGMGVWKVLDFGVSRLVDNEGTLTKGQAIGTPTYMAPEQARGHAVDRTADVFALSVVAYRSLTGLPAFTGKDVPTILHNVVYSVPSRPSLVAPDVPPAFDAVLVVGLAKRAEDRFATALELAEALDAAARDDVPASIRERAEALMHLAPAGG
jgi:serine/threonine-protein kinase